jgi:hypothetical protein
MTGRFDRWGSLHEIEIDGTAGPGVVGGRDQLVVADVAALSGGHLGLIVNGSLSGADVGSTFTIAARLPGC